MNAKTRQRERAHVVRVSNFRVFMTVTLFSSKQRTVEQVEHQKSAKNCISDAISKLCGSLGHEDDQTGPKKSSRGETVHGGARLSALGHDRW